MTRVRLSTTVDGELLAEVRARRAGLNDAALIDEAPRRPIGVRHRRHGWGPRS